MDFLGIGAAEFILILLVIILVIGPKDIGKTAGTAGRFLNRLYKSDEWRTITEASKTIRTLPNRLAREAELDELDEIRSTLEETKAGFSADIQSVTDAKKELTKEVEAVKAGMESWTAPADKEEPASEDVPAPKTESTATEETPAEQKTSDE